MFAARRALGELVIALTGAHCSFEKKESEPLFAHFTSHVPCCLLLLEYNQRKDARRIFPMSDYMDYLSKFKIEFRRVETDYEWHYALKYNVNILSL